MPYNIILNILFVLSALGLVLMVLKKLPEATSQAHTEKKQKDAKQTADEILGQKGLPAKAYSKTKAFAQVAGHKVWQFLLEAKGLKHAPKVNYNFQKVLKTVRPDVQPPIVKNEKYYINLIKRNPRDNSYYDMLGQFYLEEKKLNDALNVYDYLVNHAPTNALYWVRFGLTALHLHHYKKAEEAYRKAIDLDSSNPSRFYNLALALQGQKKYKEGAEALHQALALEPGNRKYADLAFELESKAKTAVPIEKIHKTE